MHIFLHHAQQKIVREIPWQKPDVKKQTYSAEKAWAMCTVPLPHLRILKHQILTPFYLCDDDGIALNIQREY